MKLGSSSDKSYWDLKTPGLFWVGSNALVVAFTSVSEKYVVRNVDQAARQRKCVKASRPVQSCKNRNSNSSACEICEARH